MAPMTFSFEVKVSVPEGEEKPKLASVVTRSPSVFDRLGKRVEPSVQASNRDARVEVPKPRSWPRRRRGSKSKSSYTWRRPSIASSKPPLDKGKAKVDEGPSSSTVFSRLGRRLETLSVHKKSKTNKKTWVPKAKKE